MQLYVIMTTTFDQMLLISENTGTLSMFCQQQKSPLRNVVQSSERDLVMFFHSGPIDKVIILVFGHSSRTIMQ